MISLLLQNQLLEVGWNRSESTQQDVEKTLDCCGYSSVNFNASCPAVRKQSLVLPRSSDRAWTCSVVLPAMLQLPSVVRQLFVHPADVRRRGSALHRRHRPLLQLHGGQNRDSVWNVLVLSSTLTQRPVLCFRSSEFGSHTSTGTWKTLDRTLEPFCRKKLHKFNIFSLISVPDRKTFELSEASFVDYFLNQTSFLTSINKEVLLGLWNGLATFQPNQFKNERRVKQLFVLLEEFYLNCKCCEILNMNLTKKVLYRFCSVWENV